MSVGASAILCIWPLKRRLRIAIAIDRDGTHHVAALGLATVATTKPNAYTAVIAPTPAARTTVAPSDPRAREFRSGPHR